MIVGIWLESPPPPERPSWVGGSRWKKKNDTLLNRESNLRRWIQHGPKLKYNVFAGCTLNLPPPLVITNVTKCRKIRKNCTIPIWNLILKLFCYNKIFARTTPLKDLLWLFTFGLMVGAVQDEKKKNDTLLNRESNFSRWIQFGPKLILRIAPSTPSSPQNIKCRKMSGHSKKMCYLDMKFNSETFSLSQNFR